jgi:hypothetical protein
VAHARFGRRRASITKSTQRLKAWLLVRIEAKLLELPALFSVWIAQALDVDASREASFDSCLHELRSKERKRECQIDLAQGTSFALNQSRASVTAPLTISSSQRRPRAMALTRRARRSVRLGLKMSRDLPCGRRISRARFEGGFCQGIDTTSGSMVPFLCFTEMTS